MWPWPVRYYLEGWIKLCQYYKFSSGSTGCTLHAEFNLLSVCHMFFYVTFVTAERKLAHPTVFFFRKSSVTFSSFIWCAVCVGVLFRSGSSLTSLCHVFQHHSYRSFLGLTCLMQISTRTEDFIIDTLELRSDMNILNETFTDPAIVKVSCQIHKPTIRIPLFLTP